MEYQTAKPKAPYVYICGAGPGDPGLLTIKAFYLLNQLADVVIYDRLISESVLALIPSHVERMYAGKACKQHHMTQEEINRLLVEEARKGKVVVRLKGGDPFIFGRGGEEMLYLMEHNIPFEIVPGVNAADGCAAYCGIPLTHRTLASSVVFLTGHQQKGVPVALDYRSLAALDKTLVIYMGLTHLKEITTELMEHGLPGDTPAVAIYQGTTSSQKTCFASLETLATQIQAQGFTSPTLIVIGRVVSLARRRA